MSLWFKYALLGLFIAGGSAITVAAAAPLAATVALGIGVAGGAAVVAAGAVPVIRYFHDRNVRQAERAELDARQRKLDARQAELDARQAELDARQAKLDARQAVQAAQPTAQAAQPTAQRDQLHPYTGTLFQAGVSANTTAANQSTTEIAELIDKKQAELDILCQAANRNNQSSDSNSRNNQGSDSNSPVPEY